MTASTQLITSVDAMRELRRELKLVRSIGLVPTMGALHEGHLSLVRAAQRQCQAVVVSIFVNPLQFAPNEDFASYPRTLDSDLAALEEVGAPIVFVPSVEDIYPAFGRSDSTFVDVPGIGDRLDGRFRPGHFRGVATVVAKLFHIVQPHVAFFGQKDAAQAAVLQTMVRDLNFPLRMEVCPTVREPDGLAISSRNRYLSAPEREQAPALYSSLCAVQKSAVGGVTDAATLRDVLLQSLASETGGVVVEYAEFVNPATLLAVDSVSNGALVAIAARVGSTRLIDNMLLSATAVLAP